MTEYPDWLIERVAKGLHGNTQNGGLLAWEDVAVWYQTVYRGMAVGALDALGFRGMGWENGEPQYWISQGQWRDDE